jgi:hypothetical protein
MISAPVTRSPANILPSNLRRSTSVVAVEAISFNTRQPTLLEISGPVAISSSNPHHLRDLQRIVESELLANCRAELPVVRHRVPQRGQLATKFDLLLNDPRGRRSPGQLVRLATLFSAPFTGAGGTNSL